MKLNANQAESLVNLTDKTISKLYEDLKGKSELKRRKTLCRSLQQYEDDREAIESAAQLESFKNISLDDIFQDAKALIYHFGHLEPGTIEGAVDARVFHHIERLSKANQTGRVSELLDLLDDLKNGTLDAALIEKYKNYSLYVMEA